MRQTSNPNSENTDDRTAFWSNGEEQSEILRAINKLDATISLLNQNITKESNKINQKRYDPILNYTDEKIIFRKKREDGQNVLFIQGQQNKNGKVQYFKIDGDKQSYITPESFKENIKNAELINKDDINQKRKTVKGEIRKKLSDKKDHIVNSNDKLKKANDTYFELDRNPYVHGAASTAKKGASHVLGTPKRAMSNIMAGQSNINQIASMLLGTLLYLGVTYVILSIEKSSGGLPIVGGLIVSLITIILAFYIPGALILLILFYSIVINRIFAKLTGLRGLIARTFFSAMIIDIQIKAITLAGLSILTGVPILGTIFNIISIFLDYFLFMIGLLGFLLALSDFFRGLSKQKGMYIYALIGMMMIPLITVGSIAITTNYLQANITNGPNLPESFKYSDESFYLSDFVISNFHLDNQIRGKLSILNFDVKKLSNESTTNIQSGFPVYVSKTNDTSNNQGLSNIEYNPNRISQNDTLLLTTYYYEITIPNTNSFKILIHIDDNNTRTLLFTSYDADQWSQIMQSQYNINSASLLTDMIIFFIKITDNAALIIALLPNVTASLLYAGEILEDFHNQASDDESNDGLTKIAYFSIGVFLQVIVPYIIVSSIFSFV